MPQRLDPEHQLCVMAGPHVAAVLVRLHGGERIVVPCGTAWRRERLHRQVFALREAGLNNVQIARRLGLHLRQVQRLLSRQRAAEQPDLRSEQ